MHRTVTYRRTRNAARTRARILEEATDLFAKTGFDGTSVDVIVRATGVNKRMLYHYFGDKRGLYLEVFRSEWEGLRAWLELAAAPDAGGAREGLSAFVGAVFDYFASHQRFVRLLLWEGLEGGEISRRLWGDVRGPLYSRAKGLVDRVRREGGLDRSIDSAHLIVSFLGILIYYFAYAPSIEDMLGRPALAPATLAARRGHVLRLLERIVSVRKPGRKR